MKVEQHSKRVVRNDTITMNEESKHKLQSDVKSSLRQVTTIVALGSEMSEMAESYAGCISFWKVQDDHKLSLLVYPPLTDLLQVYELAETYLWSSI